MKNSVIAHVVKRSVLSANPVFIHVHKQVTPTFAFLAVAELCTDPEGLEALK